MSSAYRNGEEELDGVWNFPQQPDNISLNSYEDTDDTDPGGEVDSALGTPLPDTDISFFDPLMSDDQLKPPESNMKTSNSWLFTAMNTCAGECSWCICCLLNSNMEYVYATSYFRLRLFPCMIHVDNCFEDKGIFPLLI